MLLRASCTKPSTADDCVDAHPAQYPATQKHAVLRQHRSRLLLCQAPFELTPHMHVWYSEQPWFMSLQTHTCNQPLIFHNTAPITCFHSRLLLYRAQMLLLHISMFGIHSRHGSRDNLFTDTHTDRQTHRPTTITLPRMREG